MKKTFKLAFSAVSGGSSKDDDAEEASNTLDDVIALLADHRELSCLEPPVGLPLNVTNPGLFPYYQPTDRLPESGKSIFVDALYREANIATSYIRDHWIRKQMKSLEPEFTTKQEVKIWVGTYNVNGKKPEFPIDSFVCAAERKREKVCYDVVVVGFQEMVDLNVQNAVSDTATKERTTRWLQLIDSALNSSARRMGENEGYQLLAYKSLVGLMICAFVLKKHRRDISSVQVASTATGVMGVVGNKGACSIRFDFFDSSFCFVCAHLAAHVDGVAARNSDVRTINAKTTFKLDRPLHSHVPEAHHSRIASTTPEVIQRGELLIEDHDYVVWFGDFNYRMDASNSTEEVFNRVDSSDFTWLYANDQLVKEMKAKRVFQGFKEVFPIGFLPTYKFEPGTDQYDRRPEKKIRAPAWTDRILWRTPQDEERAHCLGYDRIDSMRASDHKPVEASLIPVVRTVNDNLRDQVYNQVLYKFKSVSTSSVSSEMESIIVEPSMLDFGDVIYRSAIDPLVISLTNVTNVPLCWRIATKPGSNQICAPWITLDNTFGLLLPGENAQINVSCLVGLEVARVAMSGDGPRQLLDTLDFRIHPVLKQEAHTLAVKLLNVCCELRPSCFGASLPTLLWAMMPIRSSGTGEEQYLQFMTSKEYTSPMLVPKELWRLADRLKNRLDEYRVFLHHAEKEECSIVRDALDEGTPFPSNISAYAFASVLIEFLDALAEPVIPTDLFPDTESLNDPLWPSTFISKLPVPNANVLVLIKALVIRTLASTQQNKITLPTIAPLFAEVLFRPTLVAETTRAMSTASASGLGEFTSWLTSSVTSSNSTKNESKGVFQVATQAFTILMNSRWATTV